MRKIAAGFLLLLALLAGLAFAQSPIISGTKHNLAANSGNTIRAAAGGTTEICVFCHTPHGASTSVAQLWNRAPNTATYTPYTSTYLSGLGYPTAVPGNSSKVCLSCHDGALALGTVNNTPGSGTTGSIAMLGGVTTLPAGATNLGATLADDHPVGHLYEPARNAELVTAATRPFPWPKGVQLDPNLATGRVECKSCHDPHNNQFSKFVRLQITDASPTPTTPASPYLCKHCHTKTNYDLSGHATSTQPYVPASGAVANTVQKNGCLACHKSHTATGPILRYSEEATCFNAGCHGNNNPIAGNVTADTGTTRRNIQNEMSALKLHKHPTVAVTGLHKDKPFTVGTWPGSGGAETVADFGNSLATRHAECPDGHNPHQVQPAATVEKSTRGAIRISLALKGTWGVQPSWPAVGTAMATNLNTFTAPTGFTQLAGSAVTDEYQICMKCHSNYVTLPVGARNIAQEINPNNSSYHGIVPCNVTAYAPTAPLQNSTCTTNFFVNEWTMEKPWAGPVTPAAGSLGTSAANAKTAAETCRATPGGATCTTFAAARGRVWCSDCHGSEASTMPPAASTKAAPYGPHGSTLNGTAWGTSNSDRMLVRTIAAPTGSYTPLCLACHKASAYSAGNAGSRMSSHAGRGSYATHGCFTCHMWEAGNVVTGATGLIYPHGMNKRWATIGKTATAGSLQMVDAFVGGSAQTNGNYSTKQCWTPATIGTAADGSGSVGSVNCGRSAQNY